MDRAPVRSSAIDDGRAHVGAAPTATGGWIAPHFVMAVRPTAAGVLMRVDAAICVSQDWGQDVKVVAEPNRRRTMGAPVLSPGAGRERSGGMARPTVQVVPPGQLSLVTFFFARKESYRGSGARKPQLHPTSVEEERKTKTKNGRCFDKAQGER